MKRRALRAALGALLVASCGSLGPDVPELPAAYPTNGLGGYGEARPLEVCRGTARIVAPAAATDATALCAPGTEEARTCAADGDCRGIERCICGRCVVEPCQGAGACGDGRVCRGRRCTRGCAADGDCDAGERCVSGGCARACKGNGDCHHGEQCDALDEVCAVRLCGGVATCGAGSTCEAVAEVGELHEPAFLGNEEKAFIELRRASGSAVYRAHIEAPRRWRIDPEAPVLAIPNEARIGAPSALRREGGIELYVAVGDGARIVRAISTGDGASFAVDMDPVLVPEEAWEGGWVGSPGAFEFEGATYLFYEGGPRAGIGLARVKDGGAERVSKEPLVQAETFADPYFWPGVTQVGAPYALVVDGVVRLSPTVRGAEGATSKSPDAPPPSVNDSLGILTTRDLVAFAKPRAWPLYARVVNGSTYLGEEEPAMRVPETGAELVFVGTDAAGKSVSGLFRAVVPGAAE
jgi:hypothetical protein